MGIKTYQKQTDVYQKSLDNYVTCSYFYKTLSAPVKTSDTI